MMRYIYGAIGYCLSFFERISNRCKREEYKMRFRGYTNPKRGYIGSGCVFTFDTIIIGEDVFIGDYCVFQSAHGEIVIGDHVMFGPGVNIHGGNHRFDIAGKYMKELTKVKGSDGVVTICDDCWIGANVVILSGVTVGEGSVIGAGAIITKDVPPYSIVFAKQDIVMKSRFSPKQLAEHKAIIDKRHQNQFCQGK